MVTIATMHTAIRQALLPVVHHPLYSAPKLPSGHRFPMVNLAIPPRMHSTNIALNHIPSCLQAVFEKIHDLLLAEGTVQLDQVHTPAQPISMEELQRVHGSTYLHAFLSGTLDPVAERRIGFGNMVKSKTLIDRTLAEVAGTLLTAELALQHGLAVNTAGGTHHAFADAGSGFCILNDMAVAAESCIARGLVKRVLLLDLDVHQGDGSAAIFFGRDDVFTFSVHAAANFPARKQCSHQDIALSDGTGDEEYLSVVAHALPAVLQKFKPGLVIYDAGVDVHCDDRLGRLALTDEGVMKRELLVLDTCLGHNVPVAGLVGGGYHEDLQVLADRHCWLHRAAEQMFAAHGLG